MSSYLDEDKGIEEIRLIAHGEILECARALTLEALYSNWAGETAEQLAVMGGSPDRKRPPNLG
jgi:hypothetical protein